MSEFLAALCPITNIVKPENMLEYYSPDTMQDMSSGYENKNGITFVFSQKPTIRAYFNAPVAITTVDLQTSYNGRATNIIKFSVFYVTLDGKPYLDPKTGAVMTFTTADGDTSLTIQHDMINNLKGLNVTILETSGGKPSGFRLRVLGCYRPSKSLLYKTHSTTRRSYNQLTKPRIITIDRIWIKHREERSWQISNYSQSSVNVW
jgi:hypothetical protein